MVYHGISNESLVFSGYIHEPLGECVHRENTSDTWIYHIPGERELHHYFIPRYRKYSGQHNQCDMRATHDGKVECNTVKDTTTLVI